MPIHHIALFSFKPGTPQSTIDAVMAGLARLRDLISGITGFSCGTNNSPEELAQGYTHGLVMTFKDAAARDGYLTDPEHEKFKSMALPHIGSIVVFDYEF